MTDNKIQQFIVEWIIYSVYSMEGETQCVKFSDSIILFEFFKLCQDFGFIISAAAANKCSYSVRKFKSGAISIPQA